MHNVRTLQAAKTQLAQQLPASVREEKNAHARAVLQ